MEKVELSYLIVGVHGQLQKSIVVLELLPEARVDAKELQPSSIIAATGSDEERMMQKLGSMMPNLIAQMSPPDIDKIRMSLEEYKKLGSPTVGDVITVTVEKGGEEVAQEKTTPA